MPLERTTVDKAFATPHGEAAYKVCEALSDAGFRALWVGGAVRDMLQGKVPKDIDIATAAHPDDVAKIFPSATDPSGNLGSLRVTMAHVTFEVTTFRKDHAESDGRRPKDVTFGSFEDDALRRDFTVNALYFNPVSRELIDPYDGEADLRERLVRFIGNPEKRIGEDALRILRAVRLRALIDGQYHPATFEALKNGAGAVAGLSGERIRAELEKMLCGPHPDRAFEDLWELDILERIAPELNACKGIAQPSDYHREGDVWEHTLGCIRSFAEDDGPDVRWAALLHDIGKAKTFSLDERIRFDHHAQMSAELSTEFLGRLHMPRARIEKIAWLVGHHMMMGAFAPMPEERKGHWYYHPWFRELLRVMELDILGTDPQDFSLYRAIADDCTAYLDRHPRPKKPLLTGKDVMETLGLRQGEEIGRILLELRNAQDRGEITTRKEALAFLERVPVPPASASENQGASDPE